MLPQASSKTPLSQNLCAGRVANQFRQVLGSSSENKCNVFVIANDLHKICGNRHHCVMPVDGEYLNSGHVLRKPWYLSGVHIFQNRSPKTTWLLRAGQLNGRYIYCPFAYIYRKSYLCSTFTSTQEHLPFKMSSEKKMPYGSFSYILLQQFSWLIS